MERLEKKRIKGHIYYYYSKWGQVNGKSRRLWQKYLGKSDDILHAVAVNVADGDANLDAGPGKGVELKALGAGGGVAHADQR